MRWMFRGGDGAPTVAIEVGVESGNVKEGQPVFKGTRLLFQYPRTIRMLLALQSDGRAARFAVIGLKVSPSTGTILVKTDEPKTRYTDVARFEHARALPPEPVAPAAPAGIDAAAFAEFQEYKAFLASRQ